MDTHPLPSKIPTTPLGALNTNIKRNSSKIPTTKILPQLISE